MDTWTRAMGEEQWTRRQGAAQALASLLDQTASSVLLFTEEPAADLDEVKAFLCLVRRIAGSTSVIVASPYLAADWLAPLADLGLEAIQYVMRPGLGRGLPALEVLSDLGVEPCQYAVGPDPEWLRLERARPVGEVVARLCPDLHQRSARGKTLSVCGKFHDLRVLGPNWITGWCLDNHETCPCWRGLPDERPHHPPSETKESTDDR